MPNRTLKAGYTDSKRINLLSAEGERLFCRLLVHVDDFGRCEADPELIRGKLFARQLERVSVEDVRSWLAELAAVGLVIIYRDGDYLAMNPDTWEQGRAKHSKYPPPPTRAHKRKQTDADADTCKHAQADACTCFTTSLPDGSPPSSPAPSLSPRPPITTPTPSSPSPSPSPSPSYRLGPPSPRGGDAVGAELPGMGDVDGSTPESEAKAGAGVGRKSANVERIYQAYPRKVGKGKAVAAIERALRTVGADELLAAVEAYAAAVGTWPTEYRYAGDDARDTVPHPATWFGQRRWEDDRTEWLPSGGAAGAGKEARRETKRERMFREAEERLAARGIKVEGGVL